METNSTDHSTLENRSMAGTLATVQTPVLDIEAGETKTEHDRESTEPSDSGDSWPGDPDNPRNWPAGKKWGMTAIVSVYSLLSPLASTMMAPALGDIAREYHITSSSVTALTLSIFILALAIGPLFIAPLSEVYGRRIVLNVCIVFFFAFTIACAVSPNTAALITFRFLAGLAGSGPMAIGGGSISDVFEESERGVALGIYMLGPLVGPVLGPVAGGFIAEQLGLEWIFWIIAILSGTAAIVGVLLLRETYAPAVIANKERDAAITRGIEIKEKEDLRHILAISLSRPVALLTTNFICFILSLYTAIVYGFGYLLFTTLSTLFSETYGWSTGVSGLGNLGFGAGFAVGIMVAAKGTDKVYSHLRTKNNGVAKPEYRMPIVFGSSIFIPIGLLCYGWSVNQRIHWAVPILGSGIFSFGMMLCFLPVQVYLVDCFKHAASASAASSVLRYLFGFTFPLFADEMFEAMGVGGGCSLLAGLAVIIGIPFPLYIYYRGERLRSNSDLMR